MAHSAAGTSVSASGVSAAGTSTYRPLRREASTSAQKLAAAASEVPAGVQPRDGSNPRRLQTDLKNLSPEELDLLLKATREGIKETSAS